MQDLGDRMKAYESVTDYLLTDQVPTVIRLDGRAFHTLARKLKLERPMDERFHRAMVATTEHLCEEITNARLGYTQSDEISILVYPKYTSSQPYFGNRLCKIVSVLSGVASVTLYKKLMAAGFHLSEVVPSFDARAFPMPTHDVPNIFLWRLRDAIKNSISAFAETYFSSRDLENVNTTERAKLLLEKGVDWKQQESWKKHGTLLTRKVKKVTGMFGPPGREVEKTVLRHEWAPEEIRTPEDSTAGAPSIVEVVRSFLEQPQLK